MKVYVVMGNDFPEAVFSTEIEAEKLCERRRFEEGPKPPKGYRVPRIYWRVYPFELDGEVKPNA
jgi:hypothetical protein